MNPNQEKRHIVDVLFVLALFCVFAFSALVLVSIGANVYQKTVDNMDSNYNGRTAFSYVTEKIRQNDTAEAISVGMLSDHPAVILTQEIEGEKYATYLYENEGYLTELFMQSGLDLGEDVLNAGHPLLKLKNFELHEIEPALYRFTLTTNENEVITLYISAQSSI